MESRTDVNKDLSLSAALGAMALLADSAENGDLRAYGVSQADIDLLMKKGPWLAADRNTIRSVIDTLVYGSMDAVNTPRFDPPAEYFAAIIFSFVAPVNAMVACSWVQGTPRAEELSGGALKNAPPVTARQMFALVVRLGACDGSVAHAFRKSCGYAIERSMEMKNEERKAKKS